LWMLIGLIINANQCSLKFMSGKEHFWYDVCKNH